MADQNIQRGILEYLKARRIQGLAIVHVQVERGVAIVRGTAATPFAKRVCWECCRRVTGVRWVVDQVELAAL
jgi:osmotically-inducible protein OsmY